MKGWRWFIVLVVLIGLALLLKAGLVAFAGYVVVGVFLLSRYLSKAWISELSGERIVPDGQREVGDTIEVVVHIKNEGKIPVGWLLLEDMLPEYIFRQRPARITIKGRRIAVVFIPTGGQRTLKYKLTFHTRGYYQIGPAFAETGDVFGLHRRHSTVTTPGFVMVLPKMIPLSKYEFASERPIGEVRLANRLFEDPTRTAGVRPYQYGDPLQRVHWRATARTGELHCRVFEPTSLAGASILIDFHSAGFDDKREPMRSELAITTACSLAYAVSTLNQQVGLASNGCDAVERIRTEASDEPTSNIEDAESRDDVRHQYEAVSNSERLRPVVVPTRRGFDQFQVIREALARLELTDKMTFSRLIIEASHRLPKDATIIAILPAVSVDTSVALGQLRKRGFAITAVLIAIEDTERPVAAGRLIAEGIRDVRFVSSEEELSALGEKTKAGPSTYAFSVELA